MRFQRITADITLPAIESLLNAGSRQVQIRHQQIENFMLQRLVGYLAIRQPVDGIAILGEGVTGVLCRGGILSFQPQGGILSL